MVNRNLVKSELPELASSACAAELLNVTDATVRNNAARNKVGIQVQAAEGRVACTVFTRDDVMFLSTVIQDGAGRPKKKVGDA